jgi:hypothetical protein
MPGARRTRSLACENKKHTSVVTTGKADSTDIPCATVYGLFRTLPGVPGLLASVPRSIAPEFDPSVGGSGPHVYILVKGEKT